MATTKKKSVPPWMAKGKNGGDKHGAGCSCASCKRKRTSAKKK